MASAKPKVASRARVLDAAAAEFGAHGFAGARIDRIARRTRLNVNMVYYHFRSKKTLYAAVLETIYEEAARIIDNTAQSTDPTYAALSKYVDFLVENPRFADVLARELLDGAGHLRHLFKQRPELFAGVHAHTYKMIEGSMERGVLRSEDPVLTVFTLTSSVCFLNAIRGSYSAFAAGGAMSPMAWKAYLVRLMFDGLRVR